MKVGIDTLFTAPETQGSLADYLRNLVKTLTRIDREDRFYLLVSPKNRFLFEGVAGPNFTFVDCHVSNERPLWRILAQQVLIPYDIRRHGIQVLFSPADVAPLLAPCRLVLKVNTLHHFHTPYALGRQRTLYRRVRYNRQDLKSFVVSLWIGGSSLFYAWQVTCWDTMV